MGRADLTFYGSKNSVNTTAIAVGADYTYHFDRNRRGVYFLAGASFMNYNFSGGPSSRSGLGPDVGLGFDASRNLGFQIRYTTHNLDHATLGSLNLGATYTF
jgi:hypothetical protein